MSGVGRGMPVKVAGERLVGERPLDPGELLEVGVHGFRLGAD